MNHMHSTIVILCVCYIDGLTTNEDNTQCPSPSLALSWKVICTYFIGIPSFPFYPAHLALFFHLLQDF